MNRSRSIWTIGLRVCGVVLLVVLNLTVQAYTRADTLRGSNGSGRSWWDVRRYHLSIAFDMASNEISGSNQIFFQLLGAPSDSMQIDLQSPMELDSVFVIPDVRASGIEKAEFVRDGNVFWVKYPFGKKLHDTASSVVLYYHGQPRKAVNPPWDGGFSWQRDSLDRPWVAVSCQGLGASVWWPCKDAQWEEPEDGMRIMLTVPKGLTAVSNGRKVFTTRAEETETTTWEVANPINNYDVTFYIGNYAHWADTVNGEEGKLDLDYYVLDYNEDRAKEHFKVVKQMIHCFEYWMGPYPFYKDGYKLVEAPYLGMEHQGAIAYGNKYKMGYRGMDRSMTGWGSGWDYIIVHESGHEWFGNNVTAKDMADNWIHEGITSYSEVLFTQCALGKDKAMKYSRGLWKLIRNDKPVVGNYGVNEEATSDIYEKGAAIMHMIRTMTNDDERFRKMLRGLSKQFYHKTVTTGEVEAYISTETGLDLKAFFNQYLRTTNIPRLDYYIKDGELNYRFEDVADGFSLPITATADDKTVVIKPTAAWQKVKWGASFNVKFSNDFLIKVKK